MLNKFILWFSWVHAAIGAGVVTASILIWSRIRDKAGTSEFFRETPFGVLWIFAGAFCAIMIVVGLIDASINGYGTGEIF